MEDYNINFEDEKGQQQQKTGSYNTVDDPNQTPEDNFRNSITVDQGQENLNEKKQNQAAAPTGWTRFFKLEFYEQFFQVGLEQVLERIKLSFIPIKTTFIESLNDNPDFYGPFWLLTTIIFLVSSTGNLSRYFYNWTKDAYIFKLELVRYAVLVVYSFGFQVPIAGHFIMKFLGVTRLTLPQLICLYGYSFSCFIPIFLLCIIPVQALQWILIAYGMINTSAFLILNLKEYLSELEPPKMYLIFGLIVGAQVALFLTFKLVFFKLVYQENHG